MNLEERVNTLEVTTALLGNSVKSIDETLKEVSKMLRAIHAVEERQANQGDALSRAFTEIKEIRIDIRQAENDHRKTNAHLEQRIERNRDNLNKWLNRGQGVQLSIGILWTFATIALAAWFRL